METSNVVEKKDRCERNFFDWDTVSSCDLILLFSVCFDAENKSVARVFVVY